MVAGLSFPAGAVGNGWETLPWNQSDITPDPRDQRPLDRNENAPVFDDDDNVRVSIVVEGASTLDKGFSTKGIAHNANAAAYRNILRIKQDTVEQRIERTVLSGQSLDVEWNLTLAANLISANVKYGQIDEIKAVDGVKDVVLENRYEPAVTDTDLPADPNMGSSSQQIGSSAAWAGGYTGAGSTVAIIDTGIDIDHKSFDPDAFLYAIQQVRASGKNVKLMDASDIMKVYSQLNIVKLGSYSGGPSGLYQNSKVPFAFNYVDKNLDITHDNDSEGEHGSHVTGIAAGNRFVADSSKDSGYANALESVFTQGVAPDAQVITMKVFGTGGGAYDSDYMAAIEDALVLGADSVNLSLGSGMAGFSRSDTYEDIMNKLVNSDTVVSMSVGNSGYWSENSQLPYLHEEDINFQTGGSPGSFTNSIAVASVDNIGYTGYYLKAGDNLIFYTESEEYKNLPIRTIASDEPYDFVFFNAIGDDGDFDEVDVTGKIVLCYRGETNFSAKANNAAAAGAKAVIIVNNQAGTINMDLSDYTYTAPAISITQADGALLWSLATKTDTTESGIEYAEGKITVGSNIGVNYGEVSEDNVYTISEFSSWGVPGSMIMKPEIVAPGGNIYSVNGAVAGGQAYENMSGTSMASPQVAGMAAVIAQYIDENPEKFEGSVLSQRGLINSLLMSTALPIMEDYGEYDDPDLGHIDFGQGYYSVLAQGSGLANVGNAVSAQAYIVMDAKANKSAADGKVKVELGDDPDKTGRYSYSFDIYNTSGKENVYTLDTALFTQDRVEDVYTYLDTWTTPIDFTAKYTVNGQPFDPEARIDADVNNDGYTNDEDAQAVLDLLAGVITEEGLNLDAADLDGDKAVTTYDAHLILEGIEARLTVPAGGSANVKVELEVTEDLTAYKNGAYIEGFTFVYPVATEEGELDVTYSIPVLGFYGNWTDPSMYDRVDLEDYFYGDEDDQLGYTGELVGELDYKDGNDKNEYYLFGNPYVSEKDAEYHPEREALKANDTLTAFYYTLIRNAGATAAVIYDSDNNPVYVSDISSEYAAFYYTNGGSWQYTSSGINLGIRVSDLGIDENDSFTLKFYAVPEYYLTDEMYADNAISQEELLSVIGKLGAGAALSKTITVDNTAPQFTSDPVKNLKTDDLKITVKDNQYIAYAAALTRSGAVRFADITADDIGEQVPGEDIELVFSGDDLKAGGAGEFVAIAVYDYAGNMSVIETKYGDHVNVDGKMYGFTSELYSNGNGDPVNTWIEIDPAIIDVFWEDVGYKLVDGSSIDVVNAEYIDHYTFQTGADGALYVAPESDPGYTTRIAALSVDIVDMAYDYTRNELYALTADNAVYEIEPLNGKATLAFRVSGVTGALKGIAIDDDGTFYFSGSYLYVVSDWDGEADTAIAEGKTRTLPVYRSIMAWDHDNDILYMMNSAGTLSFSNILYVIDTETGSYKASGENGAYLFSSYSALYIVPSDKGGSDIDDTATTKVESVTVTPEDTTVMVGGTFMLTADVTPWTLSDRSVTWKSSDENVAVVDDFGYVTAVGVGEATITATSVLDDTKFATASVTVEPLPSYDLEGLVYDDDSKAYWSSFNTQSPDEFKHIADGSYYYAGALAVDGKTIYVHDGEGIYAVDAETFESRHIFDINPTYLFPDAALNMFFAEEAGSVALLAPEANSQILMILLPEEKGLYTVDLTGKLSANIAGITWIGISPYQGEYADIYYMILENGQLYQVLLTESGSLACGPVGDTGLNLSGAANPDGQSSASLIYDWENSSSAKKYLYVAHYADNDDSALLTVIEINDEGAKAMASVPFGDNVWPVVSLIDPYVEGILTESNPADKYAANDRFVKNTDVVLTVSEMESAAASDAVSSDEDKDAQTVGSLNSIEVSGTKDEAGKKQYNVIDKENNTVTITVQAADSTNGMLSVKYDSKLFKLVSVTGLTAYNAHTESDGTVVFDYAAANALNQDVVTLVFSYNEEDEIWIDTVFTVTVTEDGKTVGAEPSVEEIPVKVTHDHKLNKVEGVEATCTEDGRKDYWQCELCNRIFADAEGTEETTLDKLVIPAKGHKLNKVEAVQATCETAGVKEHWVCENCNKIFADDAGNEETTLDKLAVPATGHHFTEKVVSDATLRSPADHHEAATYFYTCADCGAISDTEWFYDGDKVPYSVSADGEDKWTENDEAGIVFGTDGDYEYLEGVQVDGKDVPENAYTVDKDTMTVTLSAEYLKALAEGEHTLTVRYSDGSAEVKFTVVKKADEPTPTPPSTQNPDNPPTGEGRVNSAWLAFAGTCAMAVGAFAVIVLAKKRKENGRA